MQETHWKPITSIHAPSLISASAALSQTTHIPNPLADVDQAQTNLISLPSAVVWYAVTIWGAWLVTI